MRDVDRQREAQLTLTTVRLNELVRQVIDLTRARWSDMPQQQGTVIDVRSELTADLPPIMGAESEIREALINLIFNAVDALTADGVITLRTKAVGVATGSQNRYVQLEVADTAVGINEETRLRYLAPSFTTHGQPAT